MTARAAFKQSDLDRAIKCAVRAGLTVAAVRLAPDGAVEIVTAPPQDGDMEDWRAGSPLYRSAA